VAQHPVQPYPQPVTAVVGYRPARPRSTAAAVLLAVWCVAGALSVVALDGRLGLANDLSNGKLVSIADADASDSFVRITANAESLVYIIAAIAFLMWLHRIAWNNRELRAINLRYSPAMAVGCWFIPFANFVMPFLAVNENWRAAADPAVGISTHDTRRQAPGAWTVSLWWLVFIAGDIIAVVAASLKPVAGSADVAAQLASQTTVAIGSDVARVLAAILAIIIVLRLTANQERREQRMRAAFAGPPYPGHAPPPVAGAEPGAPHFDPGTAGGQH